MRGKVLDLKALVIAMALSTEIGPRKATDFLTMDKNDAKHF